MNTHNYLQRILGLLLLTLLFAPFAKSQVEISSTYLNTSRLSGGQIATGDVLEIRAVISVTSGTSINNLRYTSTVPTGATYVAGSLRVLTNEGQVVAGIPNTGTYTDAAGDDRGQISGSAITIYMGTGATASAGGTVNGGSTTPVFYGSASILIAAFKVTVTAGVGGTIALTGSFFGATASGNQTYTLPTNTLGIMPAIGCATPDVANLITTESNGSFGAGSTHNRSSSASVTGYTFTNISTGQPSDGNYSIVKNTSPTQYTGASPAGSDRVFSIWDVFGDHTGTANATGNAPSASGANGGYMLVVNATYAPNTVFTTNISGLAANTDYTLSFWIRNACSNCGANPANSSGSGTPGVKPHLSFEMNGVDYYATGEVDYTGQWVKKSFTFNSGSLTSFTLNIKNNAPGGGGNDWVLDDIALNTCMVVLPVTLLSFKATQAGSAIVLQWKTGTEINSDYFAVERSEDGIHFSAVGKIKATNKSDGFEYRFADAAALAPKKYHYRIKAVDMDGAVKFSKTIAIIYKESRTKPLSFFPNPAAEKGLLLLQLPAAGTASISLWSTAGMLLFKENRAVQQGNNLLPFKLPAHLKNGLYIIKADLENESFFDKVMVQR